MKIYVLIRKKHWSSYFEVFIPYQTLLISNKYQIAIPTFNRNKFPYNHTNRFIFNFDPKTE